MLVAHATLLASDGTLGDLKIFYGMDCLFVHQLLIFFNLNVDLIP